MTDRSVPFTRRLAEFTMATRRQPLAPADSLRIRDCFVDWLGVTVIGSGTPAVERLQNVLRVSKGPVSVIGTDRTAAEQDAVLINGTSSHALDFDDSEFIGETHPSVVTFPAALAIAEQEGLTIADVLRAAAAGFRILRPIGRALNPEHYGRGWHGTGTVGVYASAAAAAALLDFDEDEITRALALAASMSSGIQASFGTMAKPLNAGRAAASGLFAARLAGSGFTGPERVFEDRAGVIELFGGHGVNTAAVEAELLKPAAALSWIRLKQFPTCHCTHAAMRAASVLRREAAGRAIREIVVEVSDYALPMTSFRQPASEEEAKFSQSFAVATILAKGAARRDDFRGLSLIDPSVRDLESRIACRVSEGLAEMQARVSVAFVDGDLLSATDIITREDDESDRSFVDAKFSENVASWSDGADPQALLAAIDRAESTGVRELLATLRSFSSPDRAAQT